MRCARLVAGLLIAATALAAGVVQGSAQSTAQDVVDILYDTPPWVVYHGSTGPRCDARVLTTDRLLEFVAFKEGTVLNVAGKDWNFDKHVAMMNLVARSQSGFGLTAVYESYHVRATNKADALYLLMGMLGEGVETLEVKDADLNVIATFPVTGMAKALEAWKSCADALQSAP